MFRVFLKHWIYEKCISVIFDKITHNFIKPETPVISENIYLTLLEAKRIINTNSDISKPLIKPYNQLKSIIDVNKEYRNEYWYLDLDFFVQKLNNEIARWHMKRLKQLQRYKETILKT